MRAHDLLQYQPPSGRSKPPRVRRARSLVTLAKMSLGHSTDDDRDWGDWQTLRIPQGAADASSVVLSVGEAAYTGARYAVSALHGRTVQVKPDTLLYPLGATADGDEFLALAPGTMELLWVAANARPELTLVAQARVSE